MVGVVQRAIRLGTRCAPRERCIRRRSHCASGNAFGYAMRPPRASLSLVRAPLNLTLRAREGGRALPNAWLLCLAFTAKLVLDQERRWSLIVNPKRQERSWDLPPSRGFSRDTGGQRDRYRSFAMATVDKASSSLTTQRLTVARGASTRTKSAHRVAQRTHLLMQRLFGGARSLAEIHKSGVGYCIPWGIFVILPRLEIWPNALSHQPPLRCGCGFVIRGVHE